MRHGLPTSLRHWRVTLAYYTKEMNALWKRQLRREVQQIESELRTTLTDAEVDAALSCAVYVEMAVKLLEAERPFRTKFYSRRSKILSAAVKRIITERECQQARELRWKK